MEQYLFLETELPAGALILPNPANNGLFYVFHEEHHIMPSPIFSSNQRSIRQIYLTTVDMHQNGGLGKVLEKNKIIAYSDSLFNPGKLLAVRHANGRDWWVIAGRFLSKQFVRFLVTPQGVEPWPDISAGAKLWPSRSQGMFSPDGKRYAAFGLEWVPIGGGFDPLRHLYLFDFDRCSGTFSTFRTKILPSNTQGLCFSPDSKLLYVFEEALSVVQYDLTAPDWANSGMLLAQWDGLEAPFPTGFGYGHLGPDGKIYIASLNEVWVMHVIEHPNKRGPDCTVTYNVSLTSLNSFTIPNFPNFRLGPLDEGLCDTLGVDNVPVALFRYWPIDSLTPQRISFNDFSYRNPSQWFWDFGDGTTSQDTSPVHVYAATGVYTVCLTVSNGFGQHTACKEVQVPYVNAYYPQPQTDYRAEVYPNPFTGQLNLVADASLQDGTFVLFDLTGKTIAAQAVTHGRATIQTAHLVPGMYFYRLLDQGRVVQTGKVVRVVER